MCISEPLFDESPLLLNDIPRFLCVVFLCIHFISTRDRVVVFVFEFFHCRAPSTTRRRQRYGSATQTAINRRLFSVKYSSLGSFWEAILERRSLASDAEEATGRKQAEREQHRVENGVPLRKRKPGNRKPRANERGTRAHLLVQPCVVSSFRTDMRSFFSSVFRLLRRDAVSRSSLFCHLPLALLQVWKQRLVLAC